MPIIPRHAPLATLVLLSLAAGACTQSEELVRSRVVREQVAARGVSNSAVLAALRAVARPAFLPPELAGRGYADEAITIGATTVPSPYLVGLVLELARPQGDDRALEIGTGTGYQTAVLARLAARVHTLEADADLADAAAARLEALGSGNVVVRRGDASFGWPDAAPFDVVVLWQSPGYVPTMLTRQLARGGRLVMVSGPLDAVKEVRLVTKQRDDTTQERAVVPAS